MPFIENNDIINPIEYLSYCANYTEIYHDNLLLSKATSFFYYKNKQLYLISNWHVFSGQSPKADKDGKFKFENKAASIPNKLKVYICGWKDDEKLSLNIKGTLELPLLDNDEKTLFKSKKINDNEYIDIACMEIDASLFVKNGEQISGLPICVNNVFPETIKSKYNIHPTDDVFVIGYPFGQIEDLPIWKRASIASVSNESYKIYIDTATKSGMSGSPVFYVTKGNYLSLNGKEYPEERTYMVEFIGIYSGRIIENIEDNNDDSYVKVNDYDLSAAAQLGILWKKSAIDDVID